MNPIKETPNAKRILVVKSSSLGDICNALPSVSEVRRGFPDAVIGWVVKRPFAQIVEANPFVSRAHVFERGSLLSAVRLGLSLREHRYEVALDMQSLFVSALIARLSGAKVRIGYNSRKELSHRLNNYPVIESANRQRKAVEVMLDFPRALGVEKVRFTPQTWLGDARQEEATSLLANTAGPFATLFVGATTPQRKWSPHKWAALVQGLDVPGVFVGAPSDLPDTEAVVELLGAGATNLVGKTDLLTLAAVVARSSVVIGPDSGPLHMAAVMGVPVVGLFGPTDPQTTGPYGETSLPIYHRMPCSPCYRHPTCGGAFTCMKMIEVNEVVKSARSLI